LTAIVECGLAGWVAVLIAIVAIPLALVALVLAIARKRTAPVAAMLALSLGFAPFACGTLGETLGRSRVDEVVSGGSIDPAHVEEIRAAGYAEAAQCKKVGLGGSALPGIAAILALAVALIRKSPDTRPIVPPT
jgi:hypothetical protein